MNPIINNLLDEFSDQTSLTSSDKETRFEHFINYIVVHPKIPDSFDIDLIHTGAGEFGLDGIAIIINDKIIEDDESARDLIEEAHSIDVEILFTQAKTGTSFDSGEMLKFLKAVELFFSPDTGDEGNKINEIEKIIEARKIFHTIIENSNKCKKSLPKVSLYYAATGNWKGDDLLTQLLNTTKKSIEQLAIFSEVEWQALDANKIRQKYLYTKNSITATIDVYKNITLPSAPGISESYLTLISTKELKKIITDEDGEIRKNLFFENIRDYDPNSEVNNSIKQTLLSDQNVEFPLRNNGITIVTKHFHRVSDKFTLEDFQIVNGCQTSHVIFECQDQLKDDIFIPAKIISTENEEITERIIISSNRQNEVTDEMFWSLKQVHKDLETFFKSKKGDGALYYERRAGQYNSDNVEKVKIVTKEGLLKAFSSMFLEEPNKVGRHYGDLIPLVGKSIFNEKHDPYAYYTSAYAAFRLEWLFRNNRINKTYKPFRYVMLMTSRLLIEKKEALDRRNYFKKAYCEKIDSYMADIEQSTEVFKEAVKAIETAIKDIGYPGDVSRRVAKMRDTKDKILEMI